IKPAELGSLKSANGRDRCAGDALFVCKIADRFERLFAGIQDQNNDPLWALDNAFSLHLANPRADRQQQTQPAFGSKSIAAAIGGYNDLQTPPLSHSSPPCGERSIGSRPTYCKPDAVLRSRRKSGGIAGNLIAGNESAPFFVGQRAMASEK